MKYLVGMSGGVDSSVAAVKLKKEGHEVIGVHMILWSEDMHKNKCCNTSDLLFARQVADRYEIPFYTMDFREIFKKRIVEDAYLKVYEEGRTPNPCVSCNRNIRFGALLEKGVELGADKVCTGHYAKVEEQDGLYRLKAGKDTSKDQSYFLHRVTRQKLARMYFPLGDMTKAEVMKLGVKWGIMNQKRFKRESQDLCFLPEKTPEPFLKRNLGKEHWKQGDIVGPEGVKLGTHRGLPFYTLGQRKGLDLGGLEEPLYVIGKNEDKNELVVGLQDQTQLRKVQIKNLNLIAPDLDESRIYQLKIRYAGKAYAGKLKRKGTSYSDDSGELWNGEVEFEEPVSGITPGQFVVIYDGEYCVGGGEIFI
ncbi:MAG: tRNA 2-thiouridine(34) synthase MnmA [bacterium]|nr:tRNA 2-thiouridine(34) synthase MnmA [bacterium]